jgi:hypothetical protein
VGKKKKKKKKGKKRGMLATIANAIVNPGDSTKGMSHEGKVLGGIDLAQLAAIVAGFFITGDDGDDDSDKDLRGRMQRMVDRRVTGALEESSLARRVEDLAERVEELERRATKRTRSPRRRAAASS